MFIPSGQSIPYSACSYSSTSVHLVLLLGSILVYKRLHISKDLQANEWNPILKHLILFLSQISQETTCK